MTSNEMTSKHDLLAIKCRDNTTILTPAGDPGEFAVNETDGGANQVIRHIQEEKNCRNVVIDFCNTASALGLFVRLWKRVRERGGRMALCNLSACETEVLKITRLTEFWQICDSLDDAVAAVTARQHSNQT